MRASLLSLALCLTGSAVVAQTWSDLPVVTEDYTSYSTAKIQVDPVSLVPSVAFKARKDKEGNDFNKALVYRYVKGQWQLVGTSHDNVASSSIDYAVSSTGRGYVAYADNDSAATKSTTVEQVVAGAPSMLMLGADIEDTKSSSYNSIAVMKDGKYLVTSAINKANYTSVLKDGAWVTEQPALTTDFQTYKSVTKAANDTVAYQMLMVRQSPAYPINVYMYQDGKVESGWKEIAFPNADVPNAVYAGTFKLTTDAQGNLYTLTGKGNKGAISITLQKYDYAAGTWSVLCDSLPVASNDSHINADVVTWDDAVAVVYTDVEDGYKVKVIALLDGECTEPELVSSVPAASTGDLTAAVTLGGDIYVAYVREDNLIQVAQVNNADDGTFDGLLCDTLSAENFGLAATEGSVQMLHTYASPNGNEYLGAMYAYNNVLRDEVDGVTYRDTTLCAMNIRSRASNSYYTGFYTTANAKGLVPALVRIYWHTYSSSSMEGRNLAVYSKAEAYTEAIAKTAEMEGTKLTEELIYNPGQYTDYEVENTDGFLGFRTPSTGFGIRQIVIGYKEFTTAIEEVAIKHNKAMTDGPVYNLQGQRTNAAEQGLYIQKNRKFIVR